MTRKSEPPKDLLDWMRVRNAPRWGVARPLGPLFTAILVILIVLALVASGTLLIRTIAGGEGSLGTGALIVAILSAPFLVWNTVIKQRTLEFQKEGHLTDRISKAVEQLGAEKTVKAIVSDHDGKPVTRETTEPNLEVRMGGLLSLERIAQDSTAYDKGRDHVRVMEIICAYIRNNAPASMAKNFPLGDWPPLPDDATPEGRRIRDEYFRIRFGYQGNIAQWVPSIPAPRPDISLGLTILGRRTAKQRRIEAAFGQDDVLEADWVFDTPFPSGADSDEHEPFFSRRTRDPCPTVTCGSAGWAAIQVIGWTCVKLAFSEPRSTTSSLLARDWMTHGWKAQSSQRPGWKGLSSNLHSWLARFYLMRGLRGRT